MITLRLTKGINIKNPKSNIEKYDVLFQAPADYIKVFPKMKEYWISMQLEKLDLKLVDHKDRKSFYSNNLRDAFDKEAEGFFSAVYGDCRIVANIYYGRNSHIPELIFYVYDDNGKEIDFLETDQWLSANEIEYLYDNIEDFAKENQLELPYPHFSRHERLQYDVKLFFKDGYLADLNPDEEDEDYADILNDRYEPLIIAMADYLEENMDIDEPESISMDLFREAFWHSIIVKEH